MTPDLSSTLAGIGADIEDTVAVYNLDGAGKNSYPVSAAMSRHASVLFAAVEAVLKLADDWDGKAAAFTAAASRDGGPSRMTRAMLNARVQVLQDCAQALREAITAALLGEGAGDEK